MAKDWKWTTNRGERLLGSYSYGQGQGAANDMYEFGEADVWSVVDGMVAGGEENSTTSSFDEWSSHAVVGNVGSRGCRREDRHVGGLSVAFDDPGNTTSSKIFQQYQDSVASLQGRHVATSAPVDVPDWSKIYQADSMGSIHDSDDGSNERCSEMVPPHEYLAFEYRKEAANSVFEGAGRTLKGRDMRRVRDVVWSQTGFNG